MFSAAEYPQVTSNNAFVIQAYATTTNLATPTVVRVEADITGDSAVSYPVVIRQYVTFTVEAPELDEKPRWRPERHIKYAQPLREIARPWQAKWRLKQQRPRDGLFS
jgi:hypothetical protein